MTTLHRWLYFIGIGGFAALVHITVVFLCVSLFHIHPLIANLFAFLTAFNVSFLGHKNLTFASLNQQKTLSLPHFFIVAAAAGLANEGLYFLLLRFTSLNYLIALVLVLGLVSIFTFSISRYWACR